MAELFKSISIKAQPTLYLIFRLLVGYMFALHGMQKLGLLGGDAMTGLFLVVGIGELLVGLGVFFGVLTRLAAIGGMIIMIGAIIMAHPPMLNLLATKGEAAYLNLAAFLVLLVMGSGNWGLERMIFKKETF
ncbi:MAG: DoxX family protein [Nanoarchaeota archaeon]